MSFLGNISSFISSDLINSNNQSLISNVISNLNTTQRSSSLNSLFNNNPFSNTSSNGSQSLEMNAGKLVPFDSIPNNGPMAPLSKNGGCLYFPYSPSISESVNINYDSVSLQHSNESYDSYVRTGNTELSLSDLVWTADTEENAEYMLGVIHFFRSYSLMDFGRNKTGKPPSPLWFSCYGNSMYNKVPVLLMNYEFNIPKEMDMVPIKDSWVPVKLQISNIKLRIQHTPNYWLDFSLEDYKAGKVNHSSGNTSENSVGNASSNNVDSTVKLSNKSKTIPASDNTNNNLTNGWTNGS